jgi:hypothetical protein
VLGIEIKRQTEQSEMKGKNLKRMGTTDQYGSTIFAFPKLSKD